MGVRREQIPIKRKAQEFVVEAERIVAQTRRVRLIEQRVNRARGFEFTFASLSPRDRDTVGDHSARRRNHIRA